MFKDSQTGLLRFCYLISYIKDVRAGENQTRKTKKDIIIIIIK